MIKCTHLTIMTLYIKKYRNIIYKWPDKNSKILEESQSRIPTRTGRTRFPSSSLRLQQPRQKFSSFSACLTSSFFDILSQRWCNIFADEPRQSIRTVSHRHYEIPVSPVRRTRAWWINSSRGIPASKSPVDPRPKSAVVETALVDTCLSLTFHSRLLIRFSSIGERSHASSLMEYSRIRGGFALCSGKPCEYMVRGVNMILAHQCSHWLLLSIVGIPINIIT